MKLYRLNVTADGEPSAIFALAEDVEILLHALEHQTMVRRMRRACCPTMTGTRSHGLSKALTRSQKTTWTSSALATIRKSTQWPSSSTRRNSCPSGTQGLVRST